MQVVSFLQERKGEDNQQCKKLHQHHHNEQFETLAG
jgi:hypothetical protein